MEYARALLTCQLCRYGLSLICRSHWSYWILYRQRSCDRDRNHLTLVGEQTIYGHVLSKVVPYIAVQVCSIDSKLNTSATIQNPNYLSRSQHLHDLRPSDPRTVQRGNPRTSHHTLQLEEKGERVAKPLVLSNHQIRFKARCVFQYRKST